MDRDFVDHLLAQWAAARPDLDGHAMAIVARLLRLGTLLERRLADAVAAHRLSVGEFDVLATLRRNAPRPLAPKRLLGEMLLSSGALTHRLDRLEERGLIERRPDPGDRRGVLVRLTARGRAAVDPAVTDRFEDARASIRSLSARQIAQLESGLRALTHSLEDDRR